MAAVHINTSSVQVRFALMRVVSAQATRKSATYLYSTCKDMTPF